MKYRLLLLLPFVLCFGTTWSQLTVQGGFTAQQLADHLAGPGFTVTNATLVGASQSRGKFVSNGTNLGVNSGVILSTGSIVDAPGNANNFASTGFALPGDANLDLVAGTNTNDAAILQFDFLVESDNIQFNFVFGSEEYPEFAPPNGGVNDVFAFYISGPGITGMENIALIPGTTTPVAINNVNAITYWQYYVDNQVGTQVVYDAFTTKFTARKTGLIPCQTYRLSLRIADASDDIFDSAVFLEENSLVQGSVSAVTNTVSGDSVALEGCIRASFTFNLDSIYSTATDIPITIGGSATNGVDYAYIDSLISIPPGQQSATIYIDAIADGFTEGQETVVLYFYPEPCAPPDSVVLYINDNTSITFTRSATNVSCNGTNTGQIQLNINGGNPPYTIILNGVDTFSTPTITGLPAGVYGIEVLDNYGCGAETQVVGGQFPGNPVFLPDGTGLAYQTTIPISGFPPGSTLQNINMLQSVCVDMEHSFMGQIEMRLYAPSGNYVVLKERPGGAVTDLGEPVANGPVDTNNPNTTMGNCYTYCFNANPVYGTMVSEANNYTHTYTDNIGTVLTDKYLPTGSYQPFQSLSGLLGTPLNGNWSIWVKDFNPQNNGWICSWNITLANDNAGDTVTITQPAPSVLTATITNASCGTSNGAIDLSVSGPSSPFTYIWSNGPTTQDISNIGAGSYTVSVTNAQGCVADSTFLVSNTTAPTVTSTTTQVFCPGGTNGGVDITVTGNGPFTYAWSNGAATQDLTNVGVGSYTVTVTGAGGCQRIVNANVMQVPAMLPSATITDETCGQEDGGIQLALTGGTAPFTYTWSNGATTSAINLLSSGSYSVTIHDANNCSVVRTYTVINVVGNCFVPCNLALNGSSISHETCGNGQGGVDITVSSTAQPIAYQWSNGATTQDLNGVGAGQYFVTITDNNNCVLRDSFVVQNQTGTLAITGLVSTSENCGNGQGAVNLSVGGGNAPYTYGWSNGATTQDLTGLHAGTFTVTITDGNGCMLTGSATVTNQAGTMAITWGNPFPETCGNGQGSIDITVTGGQPILTYLWSTGDTTEDLVGLHAGTYSCTITDGSGCVLVAGPYVVGNNSGTLNIFDVDLYHENCSNQAGAINLDITGGTQPLTYLWSNGATTQDLNGISAGTYSCVVTDASGCSVSTGPLQIQNNAGNMALSLNAVAEICNNGHGSVNLTVTGGTAPITYLWSTASTSQDLLNLHAGTYSVTVTDANGCTTSAAATVANQPGSLTITNAVITPEVCGNHAGAVNLSVGGTTNPVAYSWSNGATTQDISAQASGTYGVTVSDASGCAVTGSYAIPNQSGSLAVTNPVVTNAACGNATGSIDITVSGGTTPYTYAWSNGNNVQDLNTILPGTYTCTITDNAGCSIVAGPYVIANGAGNLAVTNALVTQPVCSSTNGAIDLTVTGQAPITYSWNSGATTQDRTNLGAGTYTVTITDGNGCQTTWSQTLVATAGTLQASVATITDAQCNGANGGVTLSVSGGTTYTYAWSNGATTASLSNVVAGTYAVTVSSGGCSQVLSGIVVTNQSGTLNVTSVLKTDAICGAANGSVDITVAGGTPPVTYLWSNGATTQDISSLAPGVYTCTVSASGGCSQVVSAAVLNSSGNLTLVADSIVAATCGSANGAIYLTVAGATGSLSYQWSNGSTAANLLSASAGTQTCYLVDQAGCSISYSGTVGNAGGAVTLLNAMVTDAACGNGDGGVDISPSGGTLPYQYQWSNGANTQDIQLVFPGTYTVTISDANSCTVSQTFTVGTSGGALTVNQTALVHATCGNSNGSIDITPTGATSPYTYAWSNGASTQDLNNIAAGTYTVTVTGGSCTTTATFVVQNQTTGASLSAAVVTDESCGNGAGAVNITVTGGSAPYTFAWSNGASTEDLSGLHAGTFTVTVTDGSGCSFTAGPYTVFNNTGSLSVSGSTTPEYCGNGQGAVDIGVVGGSTPYTYAWSNGASTQDLSGVSAGTYTVTVTDGSGCQFTQTYAVSLSQGTIGVGSAVIQSALCGNPVGSITVTATGGTAPYTYSWSNGGSSATISNLAPGTYTLTLTDAQGCENITQHTVAISSNMSVVGVFQFDETCGQSDGFIQFDVAGGDGNYTWYLNGANAQPFNFFQNLPAGTYVVSAVDGQGCSVQQTVILQNVGSVTYSANVTDATCATCANGAIDLTVNPPSPNYFYFWSNGAQTQDISNLLPGLYEVQIITDFCQYIQHWIVTYPGAVDPGASMDMQLYPNPTAGSLTVQFHTQAIEALELRVVDMLGKVVMRKPLGEMQEGSASLELSELPDGQYLVILQGEAGLVTRHVVVQK